jgi:DNA-directed RNA polymerase specialized sigma24 family protein
MRTLPDWQYEAEIIRKIKALWLGRCDTQEMAQLLGLTEGEVANRLARIRDHQRKG